MNISRNIAVIGRGLTNNRWNLIFKILDKSREKNIYYDKFDINNPNALKQFKDKDSNNKYNGIIYICTTSDKINDSRPYIKFNIKASDEEILNGIKSLAISMNRVTRDISLDVENNSEDIMSNMSAIIVNINGKEIKLNKSDFVLFENMTKLMEKYNYKIVDIINLC